MSYFSNILTATKSRYQSIRGEGESDGDTEDDSHISRSLRNYYTESGRPLPDWLGGGPPPVQSLRGTHGQPPPPAGRGVNASLSDIWDNPGTQGQQFQQQPVARPRFGSQNQQRPMFEEGPSEGGAGKALTSAQQRIKERLWGGRTASPPPNQKAVAPPPPMSMQMPMMPGEQHYGPRSRSPAGPSGRPYVAPGMPWDDGGHSDGFDGAPGVPGYYGGSSGGGGNLRRPGGGSGSGSGGRVGLPSGPRSTRQERGY